MKDMGAFIRGEYSLFTPLPEAALQAERQQKQEAKEKKQALTDQGATRPTSGTPDAPKDRLTAAARALAKKRPATGQEDRDGQFNLFFVPPATPPNTC